MREIEVNNIPSVDNPAYMKVGEEARCVTFPGSNKGDPGWAHAEILRRVDDRNFVLEEVRCLDISPTGNPNYKREENGHS